MSTTRIAGALTVLVALLAFALPAFAGEKVTICHAAGQAGTTKYVTLTISENAVYKEQGGHFYENGTPRAGHEEDYFGPCLTSTPTPTPSSEPTGTPEPTSEPTGAPTPTPTASPAEPTGTPTPQPTETPPSTATPTPTPAPTGGVNPATGTPETPECGLPEGCLPATDTVTPASSGSGLLFAIGGLLLTALLALAPRRRRA